MEKLRCSKDVNEEILNMNIAGGDNAGILSEKGSGGWNNWYVIEV